MKTQATTAATPSPAAQAPGEALSRPQASGQSKASFRLFFFTALSVVVCALALANVAMAATPSGEDQYLEQAPSGGGDSSGVPAANAVDLNGDGIITPAEVKKAADKNKKKNKKSKSESDEGPSGAAGGAGGSGTTPTPPAAQSVATAAKFGPVSRNTAFIIAALALLAGLGVFVFGNGAGSVLGSGGSGGGSPTPPSA